MMLLQPLIYRCLLVTVSVLSGSLSSGSTRPHIVVILVDDLGWNDVSFHGSNQIPTPHIDKLARESITLNNYYVQPLCTPTRAAMLTGKYPIHTGMQTKAIGNTNPYGLPLSEKLLPQYLKELGYMNHMIGKWHLGYFKNEYLPTYRGFDSHFGQWLGWGDYYDHTSSTKSGYVGHDFHRNLAAVTNCTNKYSTDLFSEEAVSIISHHETSQPLFLYFSHQAVHSANYESLQAPQHYIDRFPHIHNTKRKIFAGMVAAVDDSVGAVVEALESKHMMDNTIILFTTDNGGPANGFNRNAASNWPLRGGKFTYWEGGMRAVGCIHSRLLKHPRYISNNMIHVSDWFPTLIAAAGGNVSQIANLDGMDMWDMLSQKSAPIRGEILHNIDPWYSNNGALRRGEYKVISGVQARHWNDWYPPWQSEADETTCAPLKTSTNEAHTLECGPKPLNASINCQPHIWPCLFHIPTDPCEYNNLASQRPDKLEELLSRMDQYTLTMVPPGNKPHDPASNPKYHHGYWVPWMSK